MTVESVKLSSTARRFEVEYIENPNFTPSFYPFDFLGHNEPGGATLNRTMSSDTHATLLERLRDASDALAWDEFFQRYWRLIYSFARHRGCSEDTSEEIVQEVVLAIFERRDVFQYDPSRGRFRDWLGGTVRNKVAEHKRRPAARIRGRGGDLRNGLAEQEATDPPADQAWEAAFEESLLATLLDILRRETNPRTFQAFELMVLHELPGTDVARITGLTRNAVYLARRNVFRRLKQLSGSYADDGQLKRNLKQALAAQSNPAIQRSISGRIEKTICSMKEPRLGK